MIEPRRDGRGPIAHGGIGCGAVGHGAIDRGPVGYEVIDRGAVGAEAASAVFTGRMLRRRAVRCTLLGVVATVVAKLGPGRVLAAAEPVAGKPWQLGERPELPPLERLDGSKVEWSAYRGRVLLVEFWASWCPFCARQNAMLERFVREHRGRGLAMVGVSIDKTADAARAYLAKHAYSFESGMVTPAWQAIFRQRRGLPQLFVLGRDGRLLQIELGEMLEEDVAELARHF